MGVETVSSNVGETPQMFESFEYALGSVIDTQSPTYHSLLAQIELYVERPSDIESISSEYGEIVISIRSVPQWLVGKLLIFNIETGLRNFFNYEDILLSIQRNHGIGVWKHPEDILQSIINFCQDGRSIYPNEISSIVDVDQGYIEIRTTQGETFYINKYNGEPIEEIPESPEIPEEIQKVISGVHILEKISRNQWAYNDRDYVRERNITGVVGGEDFLGLTYIEIQMRVRNNLEYINSNSDLSYLPESIQASVATAMKTYVNIVMGLGSEYEEATIVYTKTGPEIQSHVNFIMGQQADISGCVDYYHRVQTNIADNWAGISRKNKESYRETNRIIYIAFKYRLKKELSENKNDPVKLQNIQAQGLRFAEYASGREIGSMRRDLYSPEFGVEICNMILGGPDGLFERLDRASTEINFDDPELDGRTPGQVVASLNSLLSEKVPDIDPYDFLQQIGIPIELLVLGVDESYSDLSMSEKGHISILVRLYDKISAPDFFSTIAENSPQEVGILIQNEVRSIQLDAMQDLQQIYDNELSDLNHWSVDELLESIPGLTPIEGDIFQLYHDIQGYGWLNPSDETWNNTVDLTVSLGIIISTIVIAGAITIASAGAAGPIGAAMLGSIAATGYNHIVDARGYDSISEGLTDIGTDLVFNALHAAAFQKIAGGGFTALQKAGLFGLDLSSGVGLEYGRDTTVRAIFRGPHLFTENSPGNLDTFIASSGEDSQKYIQDSELGGKILEIFSNYQFIYGSDPDIPKTHKSETYNTARGRRTRQVRLSEAERWETWMRVTAAQTSVLSELQKEQLSNFQEAREIYYSWNGKYPDFRDIIGSSSISYTNIHSFIEEMNEKGVNI